MKVGVNIWGGLSSQPGVHIWVWCLLQASHKSGSWSQKEFQKYLVQHHARWTMLAGHENHRNDFYTPRFCWVWLRPALVSHWEASTRLGLVLIREKENKQLREQIQLNLVPPAVFQNRAGGSHRELCLQELLAVKGTLEANVRNIVIFRL